jgi:hypothetical protein
MVTSAIQESLLLLRSILVRLLKQNLLILTSMMHPRVDQNAEGKYCKRNRDPDRDQ